MVCVVVQQAIWFAASMASAIYGWSLRFSMGLIISAFLRTHTWHNRHSEVAIFAFALVLGVCVPIAIELALRPFPLLRVLFLGEKFRPNK